MDKVKNMFENLTLPHLLWWSIVLWAPALLFVLALILLPKERAEFMAKQIRKIIREFKNGKT